MESISWQDRDDARWIELEGELDSEGTLKLKDEFAKAVGDGRGDVVVVLAGVTFLSSMGVGLLLQAREQLVAQGRALKLSGITESVRNALKLMNLDDVFEEA